MNCYTTNNCPTGCQPPLPIVTSGWSVPLALAPLHKFWGDRHTDVDSSYIPRDGDLAIYDSATNKWVLKGHENVVIGAYTKSPASAENVIIGYTAGSSENNKQTVVAGANNVLIGPKSGSTSVAGSSNVAIGQYSGISLNKSTVCLGQYAGSSTTDPYNSTPIQAGSNNIFINASETALHSTESNGFYVKPVRSILGGTKAWPTVLDDSLAPLAYNTTTGEIVRVG